MVSKGLNIRGEECSDQVNYVKSTLNLTSNLACRQAPILLEFEDILMNFLMVFWFWQCWKPRSPAMNSGGRYKVYHIRIRSGTGPLGHDLMKREAQILNSSHLKNDRQGTYLLGKLAMPCLEATADSRLAPEPKMVGPSLNRNAWRVLEWNFWIMLWAKCVSMQLFLIFVVYVWCCPVTFHRKQELPLCIWPPSSWKATSLPCVLLSCWCTGPKPCKTARIIDVTPTPLILTALSYSKPSRASPKEHLRADMSELRVESVPLVC